MKNLNDFFVTVGFVYSRWRSNVTDGRCRQIHLARHFSHAHCARLIMWITPHGSSVCTSASFHLHTVHGEQLIVCCFSVPRFVLFRVSLLHFALLFLLLPVLCPEPLLPCGQRQGKHYLRLRQSRSLALWQNSLLPQNASRTRSPRGRSPIGKMARLLCKGHFKGTCTTAFCEKCLSACSTSPRVDVDLVKSALMRIAWLKNSLAKGL